MSVNNRSSRTTAVTTALILGSSVLTPLSSAQQANLVQVQRDGKTIVEPQGNKVTLNHPSSGPVRRRIQRDVQRREGERRLAAHATLHQMQQALQQAPPLPVVQTPATAASAAGVDERPLWVLLQARHLSQFDQYLAAWRKRSPDWTPSDQLLAERAHQQQDVEIDAAFARADVDGVAQVLQRYPEQFSCTRIDRLWHAAERFAKAGRTQQALALYSTVFPACEPAANRIATLYMAQQNLGASSPAVAQLISLEAQSGQRDAQSESQFLKLQYDRDLSRLASLTPDSDEGLQLMLQLAPQIDLYQDSAAASLSGWIMHAHMRRDEALSWFTRALAWSANNLELHSNAQFGLLQICLDDKDEEGAQALLGQPLLAADPRARAQQMQLQLLRADVLNQHKQYAASMQALEQAEQLGAEAQQTAQLHAWNLYGLGQYAQSAAIFAAQYRRKHDAGSAEGWALSASAVSGLTQLSTMPEAQNAPLRDYVLALQSQQLYYRKQFIAAYFLQRQTEQSVQQQAGSDAHSLSGSSLASYLPPNLSGMDAASVTTGLTYSNHAGSSGAGRLTTLAPTMRGEWIDGTRQYNLRWRDLMLDAGTVQASSVAQALGVPAGTQSSGKVTAQDLRLAVDDSVWLSDLGRFNWQASVGAITGGAGGSDVNARFSAGQQTAWGNWTAYVGSNPVTDSLLSWRGMNLPGTNQVWGDVRRNALGATGLWQVSPGWSVSASAELAQLAGENVQSNKALAIDLGTAYNFKQEGFDYFNLGPALHYLHYANNQDQYDWGLGGYYSPQRSLSVGMASQFLSVEGRDRQWSGNLELGFNSASEAAASCLPVPYAAVNSRTVDCGYTGSSATGLYTHLQLALVQRLGVRWQVGVLGDLNLTPGRDHQYATMLFLRYFFSDRDAMFSRDLPKNTRDFYGQLDDGR